MSGVLVAALEQTNDSFAPLLVSLAPVSSSDKVQSCVVPVAVGNERIEREQLRHRALVQRVGHVDQSIVRAWTYLFNPVAVDFFDSSASAVEVFLHQLFALGFRKAATAGHDFAILREGFCSAECVDASFGLLIEQALAVADNWHSVAIESPALAELIAHLDQCNVGRTVRSVGELSFLRLMVFKVVEDGLELIHDSLSCIMACGLRVLGHLVQILFNLLQSQFMTARASTLLLWLRRLLGLLRLLGLNR